MALGMELMPEPYEAQVVIDAMTTGNGMKPQIVVDFVQLAGLHPEAGTYIDVDVKLRVRA